MKYVWFILLLTCCTIGQTTLSDEEIKALKNQGQGSGGEAPPPSG